MLKDKRRLPREVQESLMSSPGTFGTARRLAAPRRDATDSPTRRRARPRTAGAGGRSGQRREQRYSRDDWDERDYRDSGRGRGGDVAGSGGFRGLGDRRGRAEEREEEWVDELDENVEDETVDEPLISRLNELTVEDEETGVRLSFTDLQQRIEDLRKQRSKLEKTQKRLTSPQRAAGPMPKPTDTITSRARKALHQPHHVPTEDEYNPARFQDATMPEFEDAEQEREFLEHLVQLQQAQNQTLDEVEHVYRRTKMLVERDHEEQRHYLRRSQQLSDGEDVDTESRALNESHEDEDWDAALTLPKPFDFAKRERKKKAERPSRTKRSLEEYLRKKQEEEDRILNYRFRAKAIPPSVLKPRFHKIMKANERRRQEVRERSKELTMSMQKPFSFAERDEETIREKQERERRERHEAKRERKRLKEEREIQRQQEEMQLAHLSREERIKERARRKLEKAQLPPRMQAWERSRKSKAKQEEHLRKKEEAAKKKKQKQKKRLDPPDFKMRQTQFEAQLERKKQATREQLASTEIKPFNFSSPKRRAREPVHPEDEEIRDFKANEIKASLSRPPKIRPMTKAQRKRHEATQRMLEERRKEDEAEQARQREQRKREKKLKKKLNPFIAATLKVKLRQRREKTDRRKEMASEARAYKRRIREMHKRLDQERPALADQVSTPADAFKKRKANVLRLKAVFEKANVTDIASHFDKEELEELFDEDERWW